MPDISTGHHVHRSRANTTSGDCGCTLGSTNESNDPCNHYNTRKNASQGKTCANGLNDSEFIDPSASSHSRHRSQSSRRELGLTNMNVAKSSVEAGAGLSQIIEVLQPVSCDDSNSLDITPLFSSGTCDRHYVWLAKHMFIDRKEYAASIPRLILVTLGLWIVASSSLYWLVHALEGETTMELMILAPMPGLSTFYVMRQLIPRVRNPELFYMFWNVLILSVYPVCAAYGYLLLEISLLLYASIINELCLYCDII